MSLKSFIYKFKHEQDKLWIGALVGVLSLLIGYLICMWFYELEFVNVWNALTDFSAVESELGMARNNFISILTLIILPPMFMFWVFFFLLRMDNVPKGLVIVTVFAAGLAFLFAN